MTTTRTFPSVAHRIVPPAVVLTPELRLALAKVLEDVKTAHGLMPDLMSWESDQDDLDLLDAFAEAAK